MANLKLTRLYVLLVLGLLLGSFSCDRSLGTNPIGPSDTDNTHPGPTPGDSTIASYNRYMSMYIFPSAILAAIGDSALATVVVKDSLGRAVAGRVIEFSVPPQVGMIYPAVDTTNARGEAHTTFYGARYDTTVVITASTVIGDSVFSVAQSVLLTGMAIIVSPAKSNEVNGTAVPLTITVLDGSGTPVGGAVVVVTGAAASMGITAGNGKFITSVSSAVPATVVVDASALGASGSDSVRFWTTVPTGTDTVNTIRNLRLFPSRSQLRADNTDSAIILAILTNEGNNPRIGDRILFSSKLGVIDSFGVVDSTGRATAVLRSTPVNGTCSIFARVESQPSIAGTTEVIFAGVTLSLSSVAVKYSVGDTAVVDAFVTDGSGKGLGGDTVAFSIVGSGSASFTNGTKSVTSALDPNGKAIARIVSGTSATVTVHASALNTDDDLDLVFSTNNITISAAPKSIAAGGKDSCLVTVKYVDSTNLGISGAWILFATNAGSLSADSVRTDYRGEAWVWLKSGAFTGTATVQAQCAGGTATTQVTFASGNAAAIVLTASPDNIGINGGSTTLEAVVTDGNGNMVSGANVSFRILRGPGGGEYIDRPMTATANGSARTVLNAGSVASMYRAVEVEASVGGISDSTKLTISGKPYIITVSRPQSDTIDVPKGGAINPSVFEFFVGGVVQDINGNPVADGTEVHFSAVVSGMSVAELYLIKWSGIDAVDQEKAAVLGYSFHDIIFEDINNNLRMDPNIDLRLDWNDAIASRGDDVNGDGRCDYNPTIHDFFYDFNDNGVCDVNVGEPFLADQRAVISISQRVVGTDTLYDTLWNYKVYADLNQNGVRDRSELAVDHDTDGVCDLPASGDFRFALQEMRDYWRGARFDFDQNDFAVVIASSVVTKNGVAEARLTYPRQMARRLYVTVNAEAQGIRDKDGERFVLPVVKE